MRSYGAPDPPFWADVVWQPVTTVAIQMEAFCALMTRQAGSLVLFPEVGLT
jgi:hypothetical protein